MFASVLQAQDMVAYRGLADEAFRLYEQKQFRASGDAYSAAFRSIGWKGTANDRYNAACAWALAGLPDSAFFQLRRIAMLMDYAEVDHVRQDSDLVSLHADPQWDDAIARMQANKDRIEAHYDRPLKALLDSIHEQDQSLRQQSNAVEQAHGRDSEQMKVHWRKIRHTDSLNQVVVTRILDERGWLGPDVVGPTGNAALFLVIQHADLPVQEKYLPMMREAVINGGNASGSSLALLEDRVLMRQGKPQRYGSQVGRDPDTGAYYLMALEDPAGVDERRAIVGLGPLAEYLKNWDLPWDPQEHQRQLPELFKKLELFKQK